MINDAFKSLIKSTECCNGLVEYTVDMKQSKKVVSAFVLNSAENVNRQWRIGENHFRLGDDASPFSTANEKVFEFCYDGGFFPLYKIVSGRYFTVRRDLPSPDGWYYNLMQLKLYQTPNLLQVIAISVQITSDTTIALSNYEPVNLLDNLSYRSSGGDFKALVSS